MELNMYLKIDKYNLECHKGKCFWKYGDFNIKITNYHKKETIILTFNNKKNLI